MDEKQHKFDSLNLINSTGCGWSVTSFHVPTKHTYLVKYFYWCNCHHGVESLWTKHKLFWKNNGLIPNIINHNLISKIYCDASPL